ncbi:spermatogenesis-associated protein 31D1-like [Tupaia chinensis]|uniref:spermatogenesis-associated protein 31D1-like n=1 Tax=Tupaia chinensis TaxID=246437 RepID=UPI000FFCC479|nr:spermatogenesis-associated protein 31D1-like [Tupaia chinensis]
MWKVKKKKTGSDPKQLKQDYQLNFSGKMSESVADKHDVAVSLPFWSSKCKPEELHVYQKTPHPKDFEDHLQQKCTQLFWGLPTLHTPNPPLASQSSKAHVPVSILLGDSPLNSEFRKKLEHHLRKRLIQHRWGLPQRVSDSLKMMAPQTETLETPESKSSYGLSWIPFYKNHSKEPNNFGVNKPGSFRRKSSEILLLGKSMGKDQEQSTEDGPNDYSLSDSERLSGRNLVSDSEKDLESCTVSLSQNNSRASGMKLKHSVKEKVPLSEKSHRQMNYIDLAPLVKGDYCLNTSKEISFISPSKQKILEAHLKSFHKRIMTGLPPRVVQSMQIFNKREDSSQTFCHSNIFSSDISGVDSKYRVSKPLQGNSNSFHRDNIETNAAPVLYHPLTAILTVEKEGQEALRQPPSDIHHGLTQDIERLYDCRWLPLPHTHSITDNASQKLTVLANRCSSEMLTGQAGTDPEPRDKRESSTNKVERPQDKRSTNLKHFYMSNISRETVKAKKLCALDSQPSITLATSEPKIFPVKTVNMNKVETTLNTESPSLISVLQDPRSPVLKNHQLVGLKVKLENKEHNQTLSMPQKEACAMEASPAGVM